MDKSIRTPLRNTVTAARKLLEGAISERLEGQFGIFQNGKVEEATQLGHLSAEDQGYRQQLVIHLEHIKAGGLKPKDAAEQLIREIAFTHLNRLCAYKLMEARGLIRESVSRGVKSQGFFFYLADHAEDEALANTGDAEKAYRHFLRWLSGTLSEELGALFAPDDPADRLYPPLRVLDQVLELLNAEELKTIWTEDETIGWVYQYFTPKELREQARKESSAPRNSYELAFRNQFYTPRYVVEFLTDNTLGRTWYEMRQGKTELTERCRYLVRRPNEVWLKEGYEDNHRDAENAASEKTQEEFLKEPVHIPFRALKDPRDLKILDPASGSGHFLLYCFDLLERIYAEAWQDCPQVFTDLRGELSEAEFLRRVPGMILRHNLHGIDIDLRATQIASLALWLRAQRAYQEMELRREERPKITRANIVCAEPMPGEPELLEEFCRELQPPLIGQLVKVIFEKMKLAGEAGSLLKIEQELEEAIQAAKAQMDAQPRAEQLAFWPAAPKPKQLAFDLRGIANSDFEFWRTIRERVLEALNIYAKQASNGQSFRRRLFTEDTENGFTFIDLFRKKFDVVLMNPPFGSFTEAIKNYIRKTYQNSYTDIANSFVERGISVLHNSGLLGAITTRNPFFGTSSKSWREEEILKKTNITIFADMGMGVMDSAAVDAAAYVLMKHNRQDGGIFIRMLTEEQKQEKLQNYIESINCLTNEDNIFIRLPTNFTKVPGTPFCYFASPKMIDCFTSMSKLGNVASVEMGMSTKNDFRFVRCWWEVPVELIGFENKWANYAKGGSSIPFSLTFDSLILAEDEFRELTSELLAKYPYLKGNADWVLHPEYHFGKAGLTYGRRARKFSTSPLPADFYFSESSSAIFPTDSKMLYPLMALLSSDAARGFLGMLAAVRKIEAGYVEQIPIPQLASEVNKVLTELSTRASIIQKRRNSRDETTITFLTLDSDDSKSTYGNLSNEVESILNKINEVVFKAYNLSDIDIDLINREMKSITGLEEYSDNEEESDDTATSVISFSVEKDILSYAFGVILGRWDARLFLQKDLVPDFGDPFLRLPKSPPGSLIRHHDLSTLNHGIVSEAWLRARPDAITLPELRSGQVVGKDGQLHPATIPDEQYPIRVAWEGILADDPDHPDDIVTRSHDALELLFPGRGETVEQEACQALGVKSLREYFRKPGSGGFWMDHVKRYSKSRRKAPIYWLLQSNRRNYALWLYYHRLDKDLLFKALTQYVEPKIRLEEEQLKSLRAQRGQFGTSGRQAKELDQDMERQADLLLELEDFRDKLRRAADLGLEPDLNDGVVLNIAPLWELVPWNEAKKYWQELLEGKYEWSSIGKQLRAKGMVK